jgi:hypothetical protein
MRRICIATTLLALATIAHSQTWNAVSLGPVYDYWGGSPGIASPQSSSSAFPFNLYFQTSISPPGTADVYGCQWNSRAMTPTTPTNGSAPNAYAPPYPWWYYKEPATGYQLSGPIDRGGIAQVGAGYTATAPNIKGISFKAHTPMGTGWINGGNPGASVFWESDNCADGDTEYGWTIGQGRNNQNMAVQTTVFYYSYWSNCGDPVNDPNTYVDSCWALDYVPGFGVIWAGVVQCGGGITLPTLPANSNGYYYDAYPYFNSLHGTWFFKAQVRDGWSGSAVQTCDVDPSNGSNTSCWPNAPLFVSTNQTKYGACGYLPAQNGSLVNTSTVFNPQWVYNVQGYVFTVMDGISNSPYVNGGTAPITIDGLFVAN